jgi:hypothetical protein
MAEKWELATSFIAAHSGLELRLAGRKFVDFWMGTEAPVKNFRETDSWLIRGVLLSSFLTAVGALCGVVAFFEGGKRITQRRKAAAGTDETTDEAEGTARTAVFPLGVFPVVFPCLYYLTHADLRYRHPIDPVALLLTAIFLAEVVGFAGARLRNTG